MSPNEEYADQHDLLPAYFAGTLAADEAARFREHLAACLVCRRESEFMQQVASGVAEHGAEFFADHPEVDDIVAVATGEAVGATDDALRKHIALCASCAAEVAWVRGDASPFEQPTAFSAPGAPGTSSAGSWSGKLGWAVAVAAVVALGFVLSLRPGTANLATSSGVTVIVPLEATERGSEHNVGTIPANVDLVTLSVPLDVPPDAFPVIVEVRDRSGAAIMTKTVPQGAVDEYGYAAVVCSVALCPPGRYTMRVASGTTHEHEIPFELKAAN